MGAVGFGEMDRPLSCRFPLPGMLGLQDVARVILVEFAEAHESSRGVDVASGAGNAASVALDVASSAGGVASGAGDVASSVGDVASAAVDAASGWVDDASGVVDVSGRGIPGAGIGVRGSLISTEGALEVAIEAFALLERDGVEAEGGGSLAGAAGAMWTVAGVGVGGAGDGGGLPAVDVANALGAL
jgi:putative membrane protein